MRMHTFTRPGTRTHIQILNTYGFSASTMNREKVLTLCYTYIVCFINTVSAQPLNSLFVFSNFGICLI